MKCKECGFSNPCVSNKSNICKECDEQFKFCYKECKYKCRTEEEQDKIFSKIDKDWKDCLKN